MDDFNNEPRSIFASIKLIFQSVADAIVTVTTATSKTAGMLDSLASTGLVMADSNKIIVTMETKGKEMHQMEVLKKKYPDVKLDM